MGIKGLTSFMDNTSSVWTKIDLKDTKVIIDGNALHYYLQGNIDSHYGGQYDKIDNAIEDFFTCFKKNKVTTYVILDGPTVAVDKKLSTLISRAKKIIKRCCDISNGKLPNELIDPPLAMMLLVQKLKDLEIPFAVCDREADQEIASLANQWNCPVMSNDSDFFIYDLPAGYIPLTHLHWNEHLLHARIYHREKLSQHIKVHPTLLPLLASLIGNDFVGCEVLIPFQRALQRVQPSFRPSTKITSNLKSIAGFLSKFSTLDEAWQGVLAILSKDSEQRSNLEKALLDSIAEYNILDCTLASYFEGGEIQSSLEAVPVQVVKRYRHGNFPVKYLGVIYCGRNILKFKVEDANEISSNNCSLILRQIIYGILPTPTQSVMEWDRDGRGLKKCGVQPFDGPVKDYGDLPNLVSLQEQDGNQRRKLLLSILESNTEIQSLPDTEQLFAASICYWMLHATPKVTQQCVKMLILQYLQQRKPTKKQTRKPKVDIVVQQNLAQWQSVMAETIHLNKILLDAFPEPDLSKLFNGLIAHTIMYELRHGKSLENFIFPLNHFNKIYDAATHGLDESYWLTSGTSRVDTYKAKRKEKKKTTKKQVNSSGTSRVDTYKAKRKEKKKTTKKQVNSATNRFAALELSSHTDE